MATTYKLSFYRKRIELAIAELTRLRKLENKLCLRVKENCFCEIFNLADNEVIFEATTPKGILGQLIYAIFEEGGAFEIIEEPKEDNSLANALQGLDLEDIEFEQL